MKKLLVYLPFLLLIGAVSCDTVSPPNYGCTDPLALNYDADATLDDGNCEYPPGIQRGCTDSTASNYEPSALVEDCHCRYDSMRTVLVEDYTGYRCPNCPRAAEELHELECLYGARIVPVAVHVSESFASPLPPHFITDFRTAIGNTYDAEFGNSLFLPNGLINRREFNGLHPQLFSDWADQVAGILAEPADAWLEIEMTYDTASRNASASIDIRALDDLNNAPYRVTVLLTEDSVIDWQIDNAATPPEIEDYVHMHVLRDGFTTAWGQSINGGSAMSNGFSENIVVDLLIDNEYNDKHCNAVAFLFRDDTKEVIQSQYVPIRDH